MKVIVDTSVWSLYSNHTLPAMYKNTKKQTLA